MILIVTHTEDYTVDYVANILNKREIPFYRLNTNLLNEIDYRISFFKTLEVTLAAKPNFRSVWFRRIKLPIFSSLQFEVSKYISLDYESLLFNLLTLYDFKNVISDPYKIYKAENKLFQLKEATRIGFKIPKTLLTSSRDDLKEFIRSTSSIVKPLRNGQIVFNDTNHLIYTSQIAISDLSNEIQLTPAIYQEEITKQFEIRVTVVNNCVFAASVNSQDNESTKVDWRRTRLSFKPFILPKRIEDQCLQLVNNLGLAFGAIDLIYTPADEYYFLEINPNGQWVWIETDTNLPISQALVNYLTNE